MTAFTYVITHPEFRAVKVGYTGAKSSRLEYLARRGWEPYRHLVVATNQLARQIEQATIFEIRFRLYVPPYLTDSQLDHGGWTETSSLALIGAREIWDIACEQAGLIQLNPTAGRGRWLRPPPCHYRRQKGDTPRYVAAARTEAATTARIAQLTAPRQSLPKSKEV